VNFAAMILPQRMIEALGWTLFHALWQGALAALGLAVVLYFTRRTSARLRYGLGLAALALILLLSLSTFWNHYAGAAPAGTVGAPWIAVAVPAASPTAMPQGEPARGQRIVAFFSDYFARHLPLLVTLWLLGVLFLTLRFTGGMLYIRRLKYRQSRPLAEPWQERLQKLAARAGLRRPLRLLESLRLHTPVVVGHFKPVLLLPVGLVTGLPADEVEALLAHELAHVMRRDYLVNVAQHLVEILFFFHPAVRWISACVRQEREHCCDDFAVELCGDPRNYARALARLQVSAAGIAEPALAAVGRPRLLLRRITRLLARSRLGATMRPRLAHDFREGFLSALLLVVGLLGLLKLSAFAGAPAAAAEVKPKPDLAAKAPTAGRFVLVSFVLENAGTVRLEGGVPTQWGKLPNTWLVDGRDGRVVWYLTLAPGAKPGEMIPFNEEVALEAGTYGWYFPMGSAIALLRKNTNSREPWTFLPVEDGGGDFLLQRRRNDVEMLRAEGEKNFLKQEQGTMSAAERELKEKELQKLAQERAELDRQLTLAEKERKLRQEQEQALAAYALQLHLEQSLQEEKALQHEEQLKALSGAERELKEKELQQLEQEMRAKAEAMRALKDKEFQEHELQMQAKEAERRELEAQMQLQEKEEQARLEEHKALDLAQQELRAKEAELKRRQQEAVWQGTQIRKFNEFFRDLLKKQGLVTREGRYEVKLSASVLLINGKPQSAAAHEEFRKFYEALSGKKLDAATPITFVQDEG
jgi:beta-lactamase regulating signal transducer with metallopeptidase domain